MGRGRRSCEAEVMGVVNPGFPPRPGDRRADRSGARTAHSRVGPTGVGGRDRDSSAGRGRAQPAGRADRGEAAKRVEPRTGAGREPPGSSPSVAPAVGAVIPHQDVDPQALDAAVLAQLRSLGPDRAERVARHLGSAGAALEVDDAGDAVRQVEVAVTLAPRLGVVREAAGVVFYQSGDYARALRELRSARRLGAGEELVPMIVDCERAVGRAERALVLAGEAMAGTMDRATRVELAIVVAGIRRDRGEIDAGLRELELPELRGVVPAWLRLRYAYADLLEAAGRTDEAARWFVRAARSDPDGDTDAGDRALALQGMSIEDVAAQEAD